VTVHHHGTSIQSLNVDSSGFPDAGHHRDDSAGCARLGLTLGGCHARSVPGCSVHGESTSLHSCGKHVKNKGRLSSRLAIVLGNAQVSYNQNK